MFDRFAHNPGGERRTKAGARQRAPTPSVGAAGSGSGRHLPGWSTGPPGPGTARFPHRAARWPIPP